MGDKKGGNNFRGEEFLKETLFLNNDFAQLIVDSLPPKDLLFVPDNTSSSKKSISCKLINYSENEIVWSLLEKCFGAENNDLVSLDSSTTTTTTNSTTSMSENLGDDSIENFKIGKK